MTGTASFVERVFKVDDKGLSMKGKTCAFLESRNVYLFAISMWENCKSKAL